MILSSLLLCAPLMASQDTDYSYNPIGKRDPFNSFIHADELPVGEEATPLQLYEVEQLAVTGIVWGERTPKAMLLAPDDTVHVVQTGTYVGRNWGRVTEIAQSHLVVTEEWMRDEGNLITREHMLELKQPEGLNLGR